MGAVTYTNRARAVVINDDAALGNGVRAAADYDNDTNKDLACNVLLTVQWNSISGIAAGDRVMELYILPGDDAGPDVYPEGGDAGLGTNDDPQPILLAGVFTTVNPSVTVDETLSIPGVPLHHSGNRFVVKNISGQEMDLTWHLDIVPYTVTVA